MATKDRLDALDAAGQALAALGEVKVTLNYDAAAHPDNRFGAMVHGLYGAPYTAFGRTASKAVVKALAMRPAGKVAA